VFAVFLCLAIFVMVNLQILGRPLITEMAPAGIVSFELAGDLSLAQRMVESWGDAGRVYAALNLGIDYLFLVAYPAAIGLGCVIVARSLWQQSKFLSIVGGSLAWAQVGAGLLDALENYALIRTLLGAQRDVWPVMARWCAVPKFLIVALGLLYVSVGAIVAAVIRSRASRSVA
jgi:hypothetical protein